MRPVGQLHGPQMSPRFPMLDSGSADNAEPRGRYAGTATRYCRLDGCGATQNARKIALYQRVYEPSFMIGIGAEGADTTRLGGEGVPGAATRLDMASVSGRNRGDRKRSRR
jgi:hypothetical protein